MQKKYKVGILQIHPHTLWRSGGGELHASRYIEYGQSDLFIIEKFDFSNPGSYDLIHYFGAGYQMNEIGKYAQKEGIKIVGTPILYPSNNVFKYRAFLAFSKMLPFPTTLQLRAELLKYTDLLIANSKPEADYLHQAYQVKNEKIITLGTGVDSDFLNYTYSDADMPEMAKELTGYVMMCGRVTPLKNQLAVAKCLAGSDFQLVIIGAADPDEPNYIRQLSETIKAHSNILWIPGLTAGSKELKALYSKALCHVLWSETEVAALVNNEAAALGCLLVSRPHPTTKAIMKEHALYANNEKELWQQLSTIRSLTTAEKKQRSEAAKKFIAGEHTWEYIVKQTAIHYQQILES